LSNFDLVTLSLTLNAGAFSEPVAHHCIEPVDPGRGLFRDAGDPSQHVG
jgi:hypothetical protein